MALGELSSYMYEIPRNEPMQQQAVRGGQPEGPDFGLPEIEKMEGLEYVQGTTERLYQKTAALKSFAHKMYKDYGIDVTKPNLSDPNSIKAHNLFLKAQAAVMNTANALKNSQAERMETIKARTGANGQNIEVRGGFGNQPFDPNNIINRGVTDRVDTSNVELAQTYDDVNATNRANTAIGETRQQLANELAALVAQNPNDTRIEEKISEIRNLKDANYDATKDRTRAASNAKEEKPIRLTPLMNNIFKGDAGNLKGHPDYTFEKSADGEELLVYSKVRKDKDGNMLEEDSIDLRDPNTSYNQLAAYIASHPAYRDAYTYDRLQDEFDKYRGAGIDPEWLSPESTIGYEELTKTFTQNIKKGDAQDWAILENQARNGQLYIQDELTKAGRPLQVTSVERDGDEVIVKSLDPNERLKEGRKPTEVTTVVKVEDLEKLINYNSRYHKFGDVLSKLQHSSLTNRTKDALQPREATGTPLATDDEEDIL